MLNSSDNYCTEVVVHLEKEELTFFCVYDSTFKFVCEFVHLKKKAFQRSTIGFDIDLVYYLGKKAAIQRNLSGGGSVTPKKADFLTSMVY